MKRHLRPRPSFREGGRLGRKRRGEIALAAKAEGPRIPLLTQPDPHRTLVLRL
jgi:hypothetical protein